MFNLTLILPFTQTLIPYWALALITNIENAIQEKNTLAYFFSTANVVEKGFNNADT
jgi:hypothetical protein